jgi:hypothetical protein
MDEGGGLAHGEAILCQRMGLARKDRDLGMSQKLGQGKAVGKALLHQDIAVGAGDADELGVRASEHIGDCEGIIDAGIEVEYDLLHRRAPLMMHLLFEERICAD